MRLPAALTLAAGLAAFTPGPPAPGHDGVAHGTTEEAAAHAAEPGPAPAFPVDIQPAFDLIDHTGRAVTEADFAGRPMVLFFGYANCESICPVALPQIRAALDLLGDAGAEVAAVMITVDPARDTTAALAEALSAHHPRLIGLTGTEAALAKARAAFQVEVGRVAETPAGAPVYAHRSFIYLVGRDGVVKSVLPPVFAPERIAALMRRLL